MWRSRQLWTILRLLACLPAVFILDAPARALIFDNDDRVDVASAPASPFAPIGIVYGTPEAGYATAFLVDDCHVLTSQHAFGTTASAVGRAATFAAGVNGARSNWTTSAAKVVADGGIEKYNAAKHNDAARGDDWALLRLHKCLGKRFGHVRLKSTGPTAVLGLQLESAGYPVDRPLEAGLALDPACRVRVVRPTMWLHDCAALAGNSGSPLFREVGEGQETVLEVYAIESAGIELPRKVMPFFDRYPDNYANRATPISAAISSAIQPPRE